MYRRRRQHPDSSHRRIGPVQKPDAFAPEPGAPTTGPSRRTARHSRLTPGAGSNRHGTTSDPSSMGSVLTLDHEVRAADRPGQFRLLPCELERAELSGDLHAFGELEPDRSLLR